MHFLSFNFFYFSVIEMELKTFW
uniref:Uncharacterized protein n=1 Tax=Rhizophora mucronata TaxID=61149 RepID=A0A2P2LM42_RHIMU